MYELYVGVTKLKWVERHVNMSISEVRGMFNEIRSHTISCYHVVEVRRETYTKLTQKVSKYWRLEQQMKAKFKWGKSIWNRSKSEAKCVWNDVKSPMCSCYYVLEVRRRNTC